MTRKKVQAFGVRFEPAISGLSSSIALRYLQVLNNLCLVPDCTGTFAVPWPVNPPSKLQGPFCCQFEPRQRCHGLVDTKNLRSPSCRRTFKAITKTTDYIGRHLVSCCKRFIKLVFSW
ncbi:hypothetical protein PoB_003486500 [Plakobranchus ocellatus]|uniref:Uncharacterized protein n=1 Tax=Plakobranchus ocellatus TaxID=259542 RepID=A0AAV4ALX3_9GAST|nr:hypothetical protein PoB_003486500 [Plakobranchus ocellatus]